MIWATWLPQLRRYPLVLLSTILLTLAWGVVMIWSTSFGAISGNGVRQLVFACVAVVLLIGLSLFDYRVLYRTAWWVYGAVLAALLALFVFGTTVRGARSWFILGPVHLQPSEFAKVALVLVLAVYFSKRALAQKTLSQIAISAVMLLGLVIPMLLQPDLGTAVVVCGTWGVLLLFSGIRWRHLALLAALGLVIITIGWQFFLRDYQKERVLGYVGVKSESVDTYNVDQALIAIGSGGWFGKGLGYGSQSTLNFLPEKHTDFIFSVLAEEMGFVGVSVLLLLYVLLLVSLVTIARQTKDPFGVFLCAGTAGFLLVQWGMNVGINLGLLPVTGVPLPLLSYGGSGLLATAILLGLCMSVARFRFADTRSSIDPFSPG